MTTQDSDQTKHSTCRWMAIDKELSEVSGTQIISANIDHILTMTFNDHKSVMFLHISVTDQAERMRFISITSSKLQQYITKILARVSQIAQPILGPWPRALVLAPWLCTSMILINTHSSLVDAMT